LQILALPRVILQIATTIGLRFCAAATAGSRFGMDTPTGRGDAKAINDDSTILVSMAYLLTLVCEGDALLQRTCARLSWNRLCWQDQISNSKFVSISCASKLSCSQAGGA